MAQIAGHLTGTHAETGQCHLTQVEFVEQDVEISGERVVVIAHAWPAGRAEAPPVVGDHPVADRQQGIVISH